jgi:hypothetical protein
MILSKAPDLVFYPSRIRIQQQQQKRRDKKLVFLPFLKSQNCHKIENYFIFELVKKKIEPIFKELYYFAPTKLSDIYTKIV